MRAKKKLAIVSTAFAFLLLATKPSYAGCPSGTYRGLFGKCFPEIGGSVGQAAEHFKNETRAQTLGPILETWINQSEQTSRSGAQPIPPNMRQALEGYILDDVMDRATFKVGDPGVLNLAGLTFRYGDFFGGDPTAITLNDIIVFANANDAYGNPSLWAHELTHVQQFMDRGVHGFAIAYMRNSWDLEGPAYQKGDGFWAWYQQNHGPWAPPNQSTSPYYWVGIAWDHRGNFSYSSATDPRSAEQGALQTCDNGTGTADCFIGPVVPGGQLMCYAIVRDGFDLYSAISQWIATAESDAMNSCQASNDPGPGCALARAACNNGQ
jgi:hypothetical protein